MRNIFYATLIGCCFISALCSAQYQQSYDLLLPNCKKFAKADNYIEEFLFGDAESGVIGREYVLGNRNLLFIETISDGETKGVTLAKHWDGDDYHNTYILNTKLLKDGIIRYVEYGHHNLVHIGMDYTDEAHFFKLKYSDRSYKPDGLYNVIFGKEKGEKYYLKACHDNPEEKSHYCHPRAKYEETTFPFFKGLWWDREGDGNFTPLLGERRFGDYITLYGFHIDQASDREGSLNIAVYPSDVIHIGLINDEGEITGSYISIEDGQVFINYVWWVSWIRAYKKISLDYLLE